MVGVFNSIMKLDFKSLQIVELSGLLAALDKNIIKVNVVALMASKAGSPHVLEMINMGSSGPAFPSALANYSVENRHFSSSSVKTPGIY